MPANQFVTGASDGDSRCDQVPLGVTSISRSRPSAVRRKSNTQ